VRHITVLIISSNIDPASLNIKNHLLKQTKWGEINTFENNPVYQEKDEKDIVMITINDRKITHDNLDDELKKKLKILPKQAIFISRHTSKTGEPTLTVHPIGNYGKAEFGGKNKTLVKSAPKTMTSLLRLLNQNAKKEKLYHKVCFEVTHHGPFLKIPTLFIEVGSTEEEDVALEKEVAFGHMVPRYQIEAGNINDEMLEQAIAETPNITAVYFHRKSLKKSQIREYKQWFESKGIPSVSSKELPDLIL